MGKPEKTMLGNLREKVADESIIEDYPLELLLPLRKHSEIHGSWCSKEFDPLKGYYHQIEVAGDMNVAFHHEDSDVMIVSPSLSNFLYWRTMCPGDAILRTPSYLAVKDILSVRYEISLPDYHWMKEIIERHTLWLDLPEVEPEEAWD